MTHTRLLDYSGNGVLTLGGTDKTLEPPTGFITTPIIDTSFYQVRLNSITVCPPPKRIQISNTWLD